PVCNWSVSSFFAEGVSHVHNDLFVCPAPCWLGRSVAGMEPRLPFGHETGRSSSKTRGGVHRLGKGGLESGLRRRGSGPTSAPTFDGSLHLRLYRRQPAGGSRDRPIL